MRVVVVSDSAQLKRRRLPAVPAVASMPAERIRGSTAAAQVYRVLRGEILSTVRKPGSPINDREIEAELGVSRTPIREAVLRLAADGLVEILPQSGTFVARIPRARLPEAIVIRRALEELTVRAAAECASKRQVAELFVNLTWQRECADEGDPIEFYRADEEFHAAIAATAGFPSAWPLILQVKAQVDRFCHLGLPQAGRMTRLLKEHTAIAKGIRAHDPDQAVAALDVHLNGILASLVVDPGVDADYFIGEFPDKIVSL
jgi:DNA-binding GntR family transcriptional regulator